MKTRDKVIKKYDRRQYSYQFTIKRISSKAAAGYRRPGSMNPKKAGG